MDLKNVIFFFCLVPFSFNFSTSYKKQRIICKTFFQPKLVFGQPTMFVFLFCAYGFIVYESVVLTLSRKENIITSSNSCWERKDC